MLHVLQICNVGQIVGGTAACAWTVTRSLPQARHSVAFLSPIADDTRRAFAHCHLEQWKRVTAPRVASIGPDLVLLHNTARSRADERLPAVTVQYLHSRVSPAPADLTLYCSRWLARQYGGDEDSVCRQGVPRPLRPAGGGETRALREEPVIGRICTPQPQKWPAGMVGFYEHLAARFPAVRWEFIGCPASLQAALARACRGRSEFLPASWPARGRLWHWDALLYHCPTVTESFGRTVAEAMRAGGIPIVDDRGGFAEQVPDTGGFLCRQADDFLDALARLHDIAERRHRARICQSHADQHFSLARFGAELLRRFEQAAGS